MDDELKVSLGLILFAIGLVFSIYLVGYMYEKSLGCPGRAAAQGFTGEYGIVQGCVFTLPDGKKVNEKNYRVI